MRPHTAYGTESDGKVAPRYERADIHLLTTASMRMLASLLPDPAEVDRRRFRPSIVVETVPGLEGFVEHEIVGKKLAIGNATITISEPCARCSFTALAQGNLAFEPAVLHKISQHGKGGFARSERQQSSAWVMRLPLSRRKPHPAFNGRRSGADRKRYHISDLVDNCANRH